MNKENLENKIFTLLKMIGLFLLTIIIFFLLLTSTYVLPKDNIRKNTYSAVKTFKHEGVYFKSFFETNNDIAESMQLDNFTDSLILNIAIENSENNNILKKAVLNGRYYDGENQITSFEKKYTEGAVNNYNYTRYWFGILTVLKPALTITTYNSIRYINIFLVFTLLIYTVILINNKLNTKYALAYLISMLASGIYVVPMSLQFSPVFIITFIASIIILLFYEKDKFKRFIPYMFLIIGCFTAYNDLLTSPLLTFGFPIILLILLRNKFENYTFKENLIFVLKQGIIWGLSYTMTYFSKWVIASIVLGHNEITMAWKQFMFRANMDDVEKFDRITTIQRNFDLYFNKFVIFGLIIFIITYSINIIKKQYYKNVKYKNILILVIIGILPYFWYLVLTNHSFVHFWMTYRIQAITMMCIISSILSFSDGKK